MATPRNLGAVVDALYEGDGEQRWADVAAALSSAMDAHSVRISALDPDGNVLLDALTQDMSAARLQEYDEHYFANDPRVQTAFTQVGSIVSCADFPDQEAYEKSALVDFLDRPDVDSRFGMISVARSQAGHQLLVGTCRTRRGGPFLARDKRAFELVLRHIRHALDLETRLIMAHREKASLERSFDAIDIPMIVVACDMRVLHINAHAVALLARGTSLRYRNKYLWAPHAKDHNALETIVSQAQQLRSLTAERQGTAVIQADGEAPLLVRAYPLPRGSLIAGESDGQCVLTLSAGARSPDRGLEALLDSYGLTKAERRVVQHIVRGATLAATARELEVSIETVRSQFKNARGKIGARTQSDLIRVLLGYQN
jgi:DNA-binding CsgD family transcriptional regulator